jgi:hypothetical protein
VADQALSGAAGWWWGLVAARLGGAGRRPNLVGLGGECQAPCFGRVGWQPGQPTWVGRVAVQAPAGWRCGGKKWRPSMMGVRSGGRRDVVRATVRAAGDYGHKEGWRDDGRR